MIRLKMLFDNISLMVRSLTPEELKMCLGIYYVLSFAEWSITGDTFTFALTSLSCWHKASRIIHNHQASITTTQGG